MFISMHISSQFGKLSIYTPQSTVLFAEHVEYKGIASSCLMRGCLYTCMCVLVAMYIYIGVILLTNKVEPEEGSGRNILYSVVFGYQF